MPEDTTKTSAKARTFLFRTPTLLGLFSAAACVLCGLTVAGFLGRMASVLDLTSHFRMQYFLGLALCAALVGVIKHRRSAWIYLCFSLVNLAVILPLYVPVDRPQHDTAILRVMLLNVNKFNEHHDEVIHSVETYSPDFLILEEVDVKWVEALEPLSTAFPHSIYETRDDCFGIGLLSKRPFIHSETRPIGEAGVPSVIGQFIVEGQPLTILGTHPVPPANTGASNYRNEQLEQVAKTIKQISSPVLLVGDLNASPWCHYFQRLLKDAGLLDSARGFGIQPSWPAYISIFKIPIDHCLHSPDISIVNRQVGSPVHSDHLPLIVDFVVR